MSVKIEYLIGERQTGRTTEVVETMIEDNKRGRRAAYVAVGMKELWHVKHLLEASGLKDALDRDEIRLLSPRQDTRGLIVHSLYIDNAEYLRDPGFLDIIINLSPQRVVVVLEGAVYQRGAIKVS